MQNLSGKIVSFLLLTLVSGVHSSGNGSWKLPVDLRPRHGIAGIVFNATQEAQRRVEEKRRQHKLILIKINVHLCTGEYEEAKNFMLEGINNESYKIDIDELCALKNLMLLKLFVDVLSTGQIAGVVVEGRSLEDQLRGKFLLLKYALENRRKKEIGNLSQDDWSMFVHVLDWYVDGDEGAKAKLLRIREKSVVDRRRRGERDVPSMKPYENIGKSAKVVCNTYEIVAPETAVVVDLTCMTEEQLKATFPGEILGLFETIKKLDSGDYGGTFNHANALNDLYECLVDQVLAPHAHRSEKINYVMIYITKLLKAFAIQHGRVEEHSIFKVQERAKSLLCSLKTGELNFHMCREVETALLIEQVERIIGLCDSIKFGLKTVEEWRML